MHPVVGGEGPVVVDAPPGDRIALPVLVVAPQREIAPGGPGPDDRLLPFAVVGVVATAAHRHDGGDLAVPVENEDLAGDVDLDPIRLVRSIGKPVELEGRQQLRVGFGPVAGALLAGGLVEGEHRGRQLGAVDPIDRSPVEADASELPLQHPHQGPLVSLGERGESHLPRRGFVGPGEPAEVAGHRLHVARAVGNHHGRLARQPELRGPTAEDRQRSHPIPVEVAGHRLDVILEHRAQRRSTVRQPPAGLERPDLVAPVPVGVGGSGRLGGRRQSRRRNVDGPVPGDDPPVVDHRHRITPVPIGVGGHRERLGRHEERPIGDTAAVAVTESHEAVRWPVDARGVDAVAVPIAQQRDRPRLAERK